LTAYHARYPGLAFPALELPFPVNGLSWGRIPLTPAILTIYQSAIQLTPTPLFLATLSSPPEDNGGRYQLVQLPGIDAPHPYLHDMTNESFQSLRQRIATEIGWDFLSSLENAYVPLTSPLEPGMGNDWLYTGRAFSINTLPMDSGWLVVVREDFGSETYWRLYVRPLYQDGSVGIPLHNLPWNFDSRYSGDTTAYEQGGEEEASTPPGYWIDFLYSSTLQRICLYQWNGLGNRNARALSSRSHDHALPGRAAHTHPNTNPTVVCISHTDCHTHTTPNLHTQPGNSCHLSCSWRLIWASNGILDLLCHHQDHFTRGIPAG